MSKKNKSKVDDEIKTEFSGEGDSWDGDKPDTGPVTPAGEPPQEDTSQQAQADARIKDLEERLNKAHNFGTGTSKLTERIAYLEGKLKAEKSQEELYQERKAKYDANVKKRKDKDAKLAAAKKEIEDGE